MEIVPVSYGLIDHITDAALAGALAAYGLPVEATLRAYRAAHPAAGAGDLLAALQSDWYICIPAIRLADAHAPSPAAHLHVQIRRALAAVRWTPWRVPSP